MQNSSSLPTSPPPAAGKMHTKQPRHQVQPLDYCTQKRKLDFGQTETKGSPKLRLPKSCPDVGCRLSSFNRAPPGLLIATNGLSRYKCSFSLLVSLSIIASSCLPVFRYTSRPDSGNGLTRSVFIFVGNKHTAMATKA